MADFTRCKHVCAWPTFWKYWVDNYPNIKVRAKGADTCSHCLKILRRWKSGDNGTCVPIGADDRAQEEVEAAMDEALTSQQATQTFATKIMYEHHTKGRESM